MKTVLLITLLFISNLSAQNYYTFTELKGIEDQLNNTQLFYRKFTSGYDSTVGYYYSNSIYHLDPVREIDTLLLIDGGFGDWFNEINDYDFWKNDYQKYIYAGTDISTEGTPKVYRYDQSEPVFVSTMWGSSRNIEISRQDTNLIFVTFDYGINFKSADWGNTWDTLAYGYEILSVSPFNDSVIFASQWLTLFKSTDGGNSFQTVDTGRIYLNNFLYDNDGIHIYTLDRKYGNHLIVSDDNGEPFSWTERYSSSNQIYVSIDYSQSGSIYLADGRYIYHSTDYGITFNEYKVLDRRVVGIYKKPNSNKLYAATKYDLYEITSDSIKVIKSLQPDPALAEYYPLAIGNKWVYENIVCQIDFPGGCDSYKSVVEIVGDTILSNGFNYYILKGANFYGSEINFERYNQEDATVRRYAEDTSFINNEYIIENLLADVGDTSCTSRFYEYAYNCYAPKIFLQETSDYLFDNYRPKKKYQVQDLGWHEYSLVKGFGIDSVSYGFDFGYGTIKLKGCIINGVLYGDTTVVGINDPHNTVKEFSLYQNYPNPFNPSTIIKFVIPKSSFVNLKVYDILGREVATLVNEEKQAGSYKIEWNAGNFASGVYIYQIKAGDFISSKKLILLK